MVAIVNHLTGALIRSTFEKVESQAPRIRPDNVVGPYADTAERFDAGIRQHVLGQRGDEFGGIPQDRQRGGDVGLGTGERELEGAGERLQLMLREMEQLCQDPEMERDQERLRQMDQLQERLRLMIQEMDEARETLRHVAAVP